MSAIIEKFADSGRASSAYTNLPSYRAATRPRILLADDHDLLLEALRRFLEPEFTIVGGVGDGWALVEAALETKPDAVVCDVTMPKLSGLQAIRDLRHRLPETRFIVLTMHGDAALAAEALQSGADAYALKSSPSRELILAIRTALAGKQYVSPSLNRAQSAAEPFDAAVSVDDQRISPRGREVLRLLAGGRSMKETAAKLGITPRTVAFHKYRMMQQLALRSTAELVQFAVRSQIV